MVGKLGIVRVFVSYKVACERVSSGVGCMRGKQLTVVAVHVNAELQLITVGQSPWGVRNKWDIVHESAMHGLGVGDEDSRSASGRVRGQDGVLARDDGAVDVDVVLRWEQIALGCVLGSSADGKLGVERQVELTSVVHIKAVVLLEDYAEGYGVSTWIVQSWNMSALTADHFVSIVSLTDAAARTTGEARTTVCCLVVVQEQA